MTPRTVARVGIAANLEKERARALLIGLVPGLVARGYDVYLDPELEPLAASLAPARSGVPDGCDVLIAVGGDGTLLKYARLYADRNLPVLGLKGGRLGFLAEADIDAVLALLESGRFVVQERMRLCADVLQGGRSLRTFSALNDVVIHSGGYSRMVQLRVELDGRLLREFSADGLIVATPTGSTAYSLSAGGPVLEPTVHGIVLTPLNPHTMNIRPMVLADASSVRVIVSSAPSGVMITVDGQDGMELSPDHQLELRRDARNTRLVVPADYDFFARLREKL